MKNYFQNFANADQNMPYKQMSLRYTTQCHRPQPLGAFVRQPTDWNINCLSLQSIKVLGTRMFITDTKTGWRTAVCSSRRCGRKRIKPLMKQSITTSSKNLVRTYAIFKLPTS